MKHWRIKLKSGAILEDNRYCQRYDIGDEIEIKEYLGMTKVKKGIFRTKEVNEQSFGTILIIPKDAIEYSQLMDDDI